MHKITLSAFKAMTVFMTHIPAERKHFYINELKVSCLLFVMSLTQEDLCLYMGVERRDCN